MAKGQAMGTSGKAPETKIHQSDMKTRSASWPDASTKCKGGSVSDEPTRSSTAKTPGTLGGRTA